jgi:hypothetical protein
MKAVLIRCYPAAWRERYGDEFEAILEERPLGPFDVADILLGALDARLRMRGRRARPAQEKGFSMSVRIGGIAAILGASTLAIGWVIGSGLVAGTDSIAPVAGILLLVGLGSLVVAIAGLTAFQARTYPVMSWLACGLLTVGTVIAALGFLGALLGGDGFWNAGAVGVLTAFVGSTLFAVVTYRTAALSRGAAVLLGVGAVVPLVSIPTNQPMFIVAGMVCFLAGWFLLGLQAIRLHGPVTDARPA